MLNILILVSSITVLMKVFNFNIIQCLFLILFSWICINALKQREIVGHVTLNVHVFSYILVRLDPGGCVGRWRINALKAPRSSWIQECDCASPDIDWVYSHGQIPEHSWAWAPLMHYVIVLRIILGLHNVSIYSQLLG